MSGIVIIGASYAGVQVAISAREKGYAGRIRIIADETHLPYQRPPLSKAFLSGDIELRNLIMRGEDFFANGKIELLFGQRATRINPAEHTVTLEDGSSIIYDDLVIATGSRARRLAVPGHDRDGILYLRTLDDAVDLKARLDAAQSVAIVGGGFIGLEVAATAAKSGKKVTLIEAASRLLERAVSPTISDYLLGLHQAHGVTVHFGETVTGVQDGEASAHYVLTSQGRQVPADVIITGIGGIANDELAAEAGIICSNGIEADAHGRTNIPHIYAAGDCATHFSRHAGRRVRLESVQNAMDQGRAVGLLLAGTPEPYDSVPRFWSDQYDAKLQIVGLSTAKDKPVIRGTTEEGRFSVFYYNGDQLTAVDSINRPGEQMLARRFIDSGISPSQEQAANTEFDLKSLGRKS